MAAISAKPSAIAAEDAAGTVRAAAAEFVAHFGSVKRGLHEFGRHVGGARRARGLYSGEARRIEASEYLAAREALLALRRQRAAALRAELESIEGGAVAMDLDAGGLRLRVGG
jgi:hypothetical protein